MPKLNSKMGSIANNEKLQPIKNELSTLKNSLITSNQKIKNLEKLQEQDQELKVKFATFISYTDKKRMNGVIKDVNLIKKQFNTSKTSKLYMLVQKIEQRLDTLEHSLEERLDDIENSLVSDFE
jgi:Tfp pilus assembly protein PilO